MTRTPEEIFGHHAQALGAADLDEVLADYDDDSVVISPKSVWHGRSEIRQMFAGLLAELPDAKWDVPTTVVEGNVLFIEWTADSPAARVSDGIDTFVFEGDVIRPQTVRFTAEKRA